MPITTGLNLGISDAEYFAFDAVSQSFLKEGLRSWAHADYWRRFPEAPSESQELGTAADHCLFRPDLFQSLYYVEPDGDRRTKKWAAANEAAQLANPGKSGIRREDYNRCVTIAASVNRHEKAARIVSDESALFQPVLVWTENVAGLALRCKAKLDILTQDGDSFVVSDLKTCRTAQPAPFAAACGRYGYHLQMAWYERAVKATLPHLKYCHAHQIIAVESGQPHAVAVYTLGERSLAAGHAIMETLLQEYAACLNTGRFPGYADLTIDVPEWAIRRAGLEDESIEEPIF